MNHLLQILLTAAFGLLFVVLVVLISRRGNLSMRYTLGWLFVAGCIVLGGVFTGLLDPIARLLHVDTVAVVLALAMLGLLAITVQLSISVSGLIEHVRTLAEASAIHEEEIFRLKSKLIADSASTDADASQKHN